MNIKSILLLLVFLKSNICFADTSLYGDLNHLEGLYKRLQHSHISETYETVQEISENFAKTAPWRRACVADATALLLFLTTGTITCDISKEAAGGNYPELNYEYIEKYLGFKKSKYDYNSAAVDRENKYHTISEEEFTNDIHSYLDEGELAFVTVIDSNWTHGHQFLVTYLNGEYWVIHTPEMVVTNGTSEKLSNFIARYRSGNCQNREVVFLYGIVNRPICHLYNCQPLNGL